MTQEDKVGLVDNFSSRWVNEFSLPEGYIFKDENGNVINAMKIVLEKKKKEYPKTYKECCNMGIIVRDVQEKEMTIYNPDGTILVVTHNMLCVNDILLQIREQKLSGYTFQLEDKDYKQEITEYGHIKQGFHDVYSEQIETLMGF